MFQKIVAKYKNLNLQLKVVMWFTLAGFLQKGISIITTPIFTRLLSTTEYGIFNVFSAWYSVFAVIATLNLHNGVINNAFVKRNESREAVISSFQSLSMVISVGFLILSVVILKPISTIIKLPSLIIIFLFFCLVFAEPYQNWLIYERYRYNYKTPIIIILIVSFLTPLISVICILLTESNHGEVRVLSFGIVNIIIPGIVFYVYNYKHSAVFFDKGLWKYALTFNLPLIPHYLSETILNQTDKIMINNLVGTGEAGIYSVAYSAAALILTFSTALNMAFVPWQYQKLKDKNYSALRRMANVVLLFLACILALLLLFAPEVVRVLADKEYSGAVYLIPTLGASVYFNYMYQLFSRVEMYYEKRSYAVIATLIATLTNIILNMIWIPHFGYLAAGASTLIAHIIFCLLHFVFYKIVCKKNITEKRIFDGRVIFLISLLILAIAGITTLLYGYLLIRIIIAIVVAIVLLLNYSRIRTIFHQLMYSK